MLLELCKAASFFVSILALYQASIYALFQPGAGWRERLLLAFLRLAFAAWVCLVSGLVFTFPTRTNPERGKKLSSTLPVRLFVWGSACIVALFVCSWFLGDLAENAAPFISDRTLQQF